MPKKQRERHQAWPVAAGATATRVSAGRESIFDFIFSSTPQQRRLSGIPTFTTGHAIAYRTVDLSKTNTFIGQPNPVNGGAKLGMYSIWPNCQTWPGTTRPGSSGTLPTTTQYEFYEYTTSQNYGETGNQYTTDLTQAESYRNDFLTNAPNELYYLFPQLQSAYVSAFNAWAAFMGFTGCIAP